MSEHRYARRQMVSNTAIMLHNLIDLCLFFLKQELYGTPHSNRGLSANFEEDRKNNTQMLAESAIGLLQEVGVTKEDIAVAWDEAEKYRQGLEEEAKRWKS